MTTTERIALDAITAGQRITSQRLARKAGVSVMDAARALVDLQAAGKIVNYGGTYEIARPRSAR